MRPPILYLSIAFAAGLAAALNGGDLRVAACLVIVGAVLLYRAAPLGAALGVMLVAGVAWGGAARREQRASCAGTWAVVPGTHAAIVVLTDPDRKSTRLNSSHVALSRMPSS